MKKVCYLPVDVIEFQASTTGETVEFAFNNFAFMTLLNEFGDINKLYEEYEKKPYDLTAIFLYCGVKPNRTDFTLDEARMIVVSGGGIVLEEVNNQVTNYFLMQTNDEGKQAFLKLMEGRGFKKEAEMILSQLK